MTFEEDLKHIGLGSDEDIQLAYVALKISALRHDGRKVERYEHFLETLSLDVKERHESLLKAGAEDSAETRLASLKHILSDKYAFSGDIDTYDNISNADLIDVIERRKGLPISLAILYIHAARAQGWDVNALNFPGHVFLSIDYNAKRILFDPFENCQIVEASDLRKKLKILVGDHAELSAEYYTPQNNREILARLQNNIKTRQIGAEDYQEALKTIDIMRLILPNDVRLIFEAGVLYARSGQHLKAINLLNEYLRDENIKTGERQTIEALLAELKENLH